MGGAKKKEKSAEGSSKAEITVIVNEEQAMKYIKNAKVITIQDLARQTGVKISAANAFLKKLSKELAVTVATIFINQCLYKVKSHHLVVCSVKRCYLK